jgi:large subunit ribosomal protein L15
VLADGELSRKLVVKASRFSAAAKAKIEAAGGQAIVV